MKLDQQTAKRARKNFRKLMENCRQCDNTKIDLNNTEKAELTDVLVKIVRSFGLNDPVLKSVLEEAILVIKNEDINEYMLKEIYASSDFFLDICEHNIIQSLPSLEVFISIMSDYLILVQGGKVKNTFIESATTFTSMSKINFINYARKQSYEVTQQLLKKHDENRQ